MECCLSNFAITDDLIYMFLTGIVPGTPMSWLENSRDVSRIMVFRLFSLECSMDPVMLARAIIP